MSAARTAPDGDASKGESLLARCAAVVRRVIGAPDYAAYVAHVRAHHPDREPLGEKEFLAERLTARYEKPGSRCC